MGDTKGHLRRNKGYQEGLENRDVTVVHTFREGNKLADFLTNLSSNFVGSYQIHFNNFRELPVYAKTILQMDKICIPNLRKKKGKNNNCNYNANNQSK